MERKEREKIGSSAIKDWVAVLSNMLLSAIRVGSCLLIYSSVLSHLESEDYCLSLLRIILGSELTKFRWLQEFDESCDRAILGAIRVRCYPSLIL